MKSHSNNIFPFTSVTHKGKQSPGLEGKCLMMFVQYNNPISPGGAVDAPSLEVLKARLFKLMFSETILRAHL